MHIFSTKIMHQKDNLKIEYPTKQIYFQCPHFHSFSQAASSKETAGPSTDQDCGFSSNRLWEEGWRASSQSLPNTCPQHLGTMGCIRNAAL